ncbi:peptide/nickel transport system permease protein [Amycolatopsis bartoniae]|uniref:Peptide ABC transporter permease n=1 Tax=Amycolatopsis bartoniae TaxID=941986 RepID=A0A8H9IR46_9PSEU|nr:ABC transporter permease [Amycolatopsis bartoniae]MBB2937815.1 peptide/nickel transport system permease protein [Amycolatopsis bartoniae]TVT06518.1 ABC transporter permease [Amycolatopsis bartoniae]GHF40913.1 peptide ABC transporter permease [Amycolatopsis bartoniae]
MSDILSPGGAPVPAAAPAARGLLRTLRRDRWAQASAVVIVLVVLTALAAPLLALAEGQDPYTYHTDLLDPSNGTGAGALGGISGSHWFGVEPLTGRDLFAVVAYGARTSFLIGLAATVVSMVVGVLLGASAGYTGGWWDTVVSRVTDVLLGFPQLIFMISVGAVAPAAIPRPLLLIAVIGLFGWPRVARVVRAQTLSLRGRDFVRAARALGAGGVHVFRRELLPNLWAPIIVLATVTIPYNIGLEAALSFLGVGIPPPTPSWGRSISDAINWVQTDPMFLIFPGAALFVATLAFNMLGDGLRDALDPKTAVRR